MKHATRRVTVSILAAAVILCAVPTASFAAGTRTPETIEITYSFNSGEAGSGPPPTDTVTWRDDCFLRSSFLGCCHLAEVSAAAALASSPCVDPDLTPEQNEPLAPRYVMEFLTKAHFQDVETNRYYTVRSRENSVAAACGHKTLRDGDKTYTLLAIVIRSINYTQEWTGNFTITGDGDFGGHMHAGFKAARDEALRYAAKYLKDHGITGDLKVWIAGHSRGAATSNALGGFFAGGGEAYFRARGIPVSIIPENVFCYTFSTPRTIRPGLTHAEDLSVAGSRDGYPDDTPGEAYACADSGSVNPTGSCYQGIRNYPKYHDIVTKLPPSIPGWDFTYYGQVCQYDSSDLPGGPVTEAEMLQQLKAFDWQLYQTFTNGGSPEDYRRVTLDHDRLIEKVCAGGKIDIPDIMKPTDKAPATLGDMVQSRVSSMEMIAASPGAFAENDGQHALQALGGLIGMVSLDMNDPNLNFSDLIHAAVFWVLDYSVTRLREGETGEAVAVVRFLEKLLSYLLPHESIPQDSLCLTSIAEMASRYIFPQSGDTKVSEKVVALVADNLPDPHAGEIADFIYAYLNLYLPEGADPDSYTKAQRVGAFLKACGWGPADNTQAKKDGDTAESTSRDLCYILVAADVAGVMDLPDWLVEALAEPDAPAKFPGQIQSMLASLMPAGEPYHNLTTAADAWGRHAAASLFQDPLKDLVTKGYSQGYILDARRHFEELKTYIRPLRYAILTFLTATPGESLSVEAMIRNVSLFVANDGLIVPSHLVQIDLAWAKARRARGLWDHEPVPTPTPAPKPLPPTGDSASLPLWIGMLLLGLLGLACVIFFDISYHPTDYAEKPLKNHSGGACK